MESTLKAKLTLRAQELTFTTDNRDEYYLTVKLQRQLKLTDIAREVAALNTRQEDVAEIERTLHQGLEKIAWFLSSGYSVSTPIGNFRPTVNGVLTGSEIVSTPDRDRLRLGVNYTMNAPMRRAMESAELDVKILRAPKGPQIYQLLNIADMGNPAAQTRGEARGIRAGEVCLIRGKKIKVGGPDPSVGVTLTRIDTPAADPSTAEATAAVTTADPSTAISTPDTASNPTTSEASTTPDTYFFPASQLYPNTPTRVGFVMPSTAPTGSQWRVTLCTQWTNSAKLLTTPRSALLAEPFIIS